ncbi:MAG: HD domain-containing phosphohydrolase [Mariprofundales bacterium]|nr:HD domain-containing phosphohydrolase [Mariprofundales bacterium]
MVHNQLLQRIERLNEIGASLSAETDNGKILESILHGARELTGADGGTLYRVDDNNMLYFNLLETESLGIHMGQDSENPLPMAPIPLYDEAGLPNDNLVAVNAAIHGQTINIADAYDAEGFNFTGTRAFDKKTGYRSKSFLTVPMTNQRQEIIGVLQLINAQQEDGTIIPFSQENQELAESLASQAAVAITNHQLVSELKLLMESFIDVISQAIDAKSPYTGGHCRRVPEIALMLADAVSETTDGQFSDYHLSDEQRYEMKIAAMMHDCGKITTPVHIVDKGTKLETIYDRIDLVDARFELVHKDAEITMLREKMAQQQIEWSEEDQGRLKHQQDAIELDRAFVHQCNQGGEFMAETLQQRVTTIGQRQWTDHVGESKPLLTDNEITNLNITKGTLLPEEREIINNHITLTIKMLRSLPFPSHLRNVPEIAGGHHEKMDGTGYPLGLKREEMSIEARMLGIADIFEALTACDRPYKDGMPLSRVIQIMGFMKKEHHIDPDLFDEFVIRKVYLQYAKTYLKPELIDMD